MKNCKKTRMFTGLIFILMVFVFNSCSQKENVDKTGKMENNKNEDLVVINESDIEEKDEDLLLTDYKEFYSELAPHGEWIEVNDKDIEIDLDISSAVSGKDKNRKIKFSDFIGISEAYADNFEAGSFFVWKPSAGLAVSIEGEDKTEFVPYTNGQWTNTDAGWYFKAPTPAEETVHHYGRWAKSPILGWVWVPGRVWAPSWVDWKENEDQISWAPIPPSVNIVSNTIQVPVIPQSNYITAEKRNFFEPAIYKYSYKYHENKNKIMIKEMTKISGVMVVNNTIINKGPNVLVIEQLANREAGIFKVIKVKSRNEINNNGEVLNVYVPQFRKYKTSEKVKSIISKPEKFVNFETAKTKFESNEKSATGNKNSEIENKNENKNKESQQKSGITNYKNNNRGNDDDKGKNKDEIKTKNKERKSDDESNGNKSKGKDDEVKKRENDDRGGDKNKVKGKGSNGNKNRKGKNK
ncbi:MAG: DUF6600 domain-containing protein [Ignavibacteria bacterium]